MKRPNIIAKLLLLLKFHAVAFDDAIKFKIQKNFKIQISQKQKGLCCEIKTFFLVSKVLSTRLKNKNSKNMPYTTFNKFSKVL